MAGVDHGLALELQVTEAVSPKKMKVTGIAVVQVKLKATCTDSKLLGFPGSGDQAEPVALSPYVTPKAPTSRASA